MKPYTSVGLIECENLEKSYVERSAALPKHLQVNKAFVIYEAAKTALRNRFPDLELATDAEAILQDASIGLVLISAPPEKHRRLIGAALKANKQVQIV